jgi:iron complex outermembrane recepter protein
MVLRGGCGKRGALAVLVCGALACQPARAAGDVADMDISELVELRLSPFDVAQNLDRGYRASNAVSGSRFDTPIRELPFAIQSFTETFIRDQKPVDLNDIARYSPGVTYRSNDFNEGNANLAIRGFAVASAPGATQVMRDGALGPSIFDFTNVARVEVVKGPSSFLYGQVAPGGIVNVITKSPQPRFAATGALTLGSYGQRRLEGDVTGPVSGTLFYRLAASRFDDIHYWEPYDAHTTDVAPSLLWQPDERLSVTLKGESFRKVETPQVMQKPLYTRQAGVVPTAGDPNRLGVEVPGLPDTWNSMAYGDYRRSSADSLGAWADVRASERWSLRGGVSLQRFEVDALFSGNLGMANNTTFLQGRRLRRQTYTNHSDTASLDGVGRYEWQAATLRLLFGAQFVRRRFDSSAGQAPNDPALGNNPTASPLPLWDLRDPATWNREVHIPLDTLTVSAFDNVLMQRDRSVYGGATVGLLNDRLRLLAGWRMNWADSELTSRLSGAVQPFAARRGTPQFGLLYEAAPGVALFGSYARSFVPGSQLLLRPDGSSGPAAPSEGSGWDLGVKAHLLDGRLSGTLSLFDLRNSRIVNDLAATNSAGAVVITNVQSGQQRSRGVELDATITPTPPWQVYLSYSWMDARIVEFSGNDAAILAQDPATLDAAGRVNYKNVYLLHDAPLQMSAPRLANLWTRYDFAEGALAGAYVGGGVNVVRDQTLLPDGPPSLRQSYTLVNALAGYGWRHGRRHLAVELMGKNITDEHYRPSQSTRSRPRELLFTFRASL